MASLAGLAPHVSQSGAAPPSRRHRRGGRPLRSRRALHGRPGRRPPPPQARRRLQRPSPARKPGKVALIAIARKLLVTANALVKADTPYQGKTLDT
ncbi:MAG: hypothetical protein MZV49_12545 [Rhodopseudomonas palustris]|nr:hypothetical protein [Rhodopseudomonas palustris]